MGEQFNALGDAESLNEVFARSEDAPVIIFKHSLTCPISRAAYGEMSKLADETIALVVVQRTRDLSREVESRTGVRHETPQALIVRRGAAVWSASHWDVTAEAVTKAMSEHT